MSEKELIEMMYRKHQKLFLNVTEASIEWGSSSSYVNKLFGGKDALPESLILEKNIIPAWKKIGNKRMWSLTSIAQWILNTESLL